MAAASLTLHRATAAGSFADRSEQFLLRNEAAHNLILGSTADLRRSRGSQAPAAEPPYLAPIEAAGQVVAAAVRTPPFNLVLSRVNETQIDHVVDLLVEDV